MATAFRLDLSSGRIRGSRFGGREGYTVVRVETDVVPRGAAQLPPFWSLVETHGDELLRHARRLAGDDCEDVLQDALLKALRSYPRLSHGNHLRAWLFRITTTTAFDHGAAKTRDAATRAPADDLNESAAVYGPMTDSLESFERLIDPLPDHAQHVLYLRFVEDLEHAEIARRLGCSVAAARQRLSSAVRTLRRRMT